METKDVPVKGRLTRLMGTWDVRAYTMIGALLFIWLLFGMLDSTFLTSRNLSNLFTQMSVISILAIGMVLVIVAGHIDLSVGSVVGFTGGLSAILSTWLGFPIWVVVLGTLAAGACIGFVQGWLVAYRAVPAFIVTLGGMMVFRGALMGVTNSTTISISDPAYVLLGDAYFTRGFSLIMVVLVTGAIIWSTMRRRRSRRKYGFEVMPVGVDALKIIFYSALILAFVLTMNNYKGVPLPIGFVILSALVFSFIAHKTSFGRHIYAIGGNPEAAALSGINIKSRTMMVFLLNGLLASIAALLLTSRLTSATISAGQMYELDAIAACVIGGTSLMGGTGTILGALIGSLVMASLDNGMSLMGVESFWQYIVKGSILVLAVWLDISSRKRKVAK
ncbi:sugar ABC transporter permease [Paenactinomyces guangxiensis]|uniref:Xylose transport system permease protein XylH n=1 Tax=Paenactinomyces guangxiensis TaxID=1490290 RepID=A0A7W2A7V1_9BACL|nr:sugar ABC transporter permease [Paenactinomyces guangxiensis]MBA4493985.1 sugar ABC transporter permease [Paenactinomyces guangxiensis]MBH8593406.1 sugar ABC transporter permease [Paenactinomyces guangxiensis]